MKWFWLQKDQKAFAFLDAVFETDCNGSDYFKSQDLKIHQQAEATSTLCNQYLARIHIWEQFYF